MPKKLSHVAEILGRAFVGHDQPIHGLSNALDSGQNDLVFVLDSKTLKNVSSIAARSWILFRPLLEKIHSKDRSDLSYILTDTPYVDLINLIEYFYPPTKVSTTIHKSAILPGSVKKGKGLRVDALVVVGKNSSIGDFTALGSQCVIGDHVKIGKRCRIYPHVTIYDHCEIGDDVIIHSGSVIGSDGFGFTRLAEKIEKIRHVGKVVIADAVEIGANCTIDRGTLGATRIGRGTKLDNLIQVAHNVQIGEYALIAAQSGLAGSTHIGSYATIAGQVGIVGHITIGDHVTIAAQAGVIGDVTDGQTVSGYPARPHAMALRREAYISRIPEILEQLKNK